MKVHRDLSVLLVIYAALCITPLFLHDNLAVMHLLIMCLIYAVVAGSWDLMMGFGGVFSFAQVAFYVIGAYASAIITNHFGISPWLGIIAGGAMASSTGILISLPCLRIKGSYVALLTFALHLLLEPLLKSDLGTAIGTGGTGGIIGIPKLTIGEYAFSKLEVLPPFYTALALSFAAFFVMYKVIYSRWGLAFSAIRDSEPLAISLGVDYCWFKLLLFGISAFLAGATGAFYAHYTGVLSSRLLGLDMFLMLLVMQVIGGQGLFPGALAGSFIITFTSEYLRVAGVYRLVIFGAMVVLLCALMPRGFMGIIYGNPGERSRTHTLFRRLFPFRYGGACRKTGGYAGEENRDVHS